MSMLDIRPDILHCRLMIELLNARGSSFACFAGFILPLLEGDHEQETITMLYRLRAASAGMSLPVLDRLEVWLEGLAQAQASTTRSLQELRKLAAEFADAPGTESMLLYPWLVWSTAGVIIIRRRRPPGR
jgi:hypothetical protein